jgi:tripartite-type tricarboxylate transporter receptor subunit TctC
LKEPELASALAKQGVIPETLSPEQLAGVVKKDAEVFREVARKANFKKASLGK